MEYYISKNHLNKNEENCIGRTSTIGIINKDDLIREIAKEGTGITSYEVESIFKRLEIVLSDLLKKGYGINTPILNITPSIRGIFKDWDDSFDPKRHLLQFKTSSGVILKKAAKETKLYKSEPTSYTIDIFSFTSHNKNENKDILTPNSIGELKGNKLKFDDTDIKQGIFLIAEDGSECRIDVYAHNTKAKQLFQIPSILATGKYVLELRSLPLHSSQLKSGRLDTPLFVL
ncbi:DNA-binding domain-containing protein [Ancylomarina sp.]|uniref:DNA-binding domain-containing protein n=1 Tax=Ancylomarina sp. TaxID=1970196 RepID=UPI003562655D